MDIQTLRAKVTSLERSKPGTVKLAAAYNTLGDEYKKQSELDEAIRNYEKALHIYRQKSRKSMKVATTSQSLASVFFDQEEWVKGCTFLRPGIEILEQKIPRSMDLAIAHDSMAVGLFVSGEHEEACQYFQKALDVFQRKAPDSLRTAFTCFWFAQALRSRNDMNKARQLFERALEIHQMHDAESIHVADVLARFVSVLHDMGETELARHYFEEALEIVSQEPDSAHLGSVYGNLAEYMYKQGNTYQEQRLFQKAVTIGERFGTDTFQDRVSLGLSLYKSGERVNARFHYERVIDMYEGGRLQGNLSVGAACESYFVANAYFGTGRILDDEAKYTQSLVYYQIALDIYNRFDFKEMEKFGSFDQQSWPTINMIEQRIALHPSRLLTMEHPLLPSIWCHVFAKCESDIQSICYMLREQPHIVEVCSCNATRKRTMLRPQRKCRMKQVRYT